ncbi:helix-turn-helix transcriptional regulator [Vibrio sonorensis]|uniref:helix-turn-helix transcriptional regulator n=1 Tax=Vibrio sonorensis TaxID=1004316 RepID=UPI0008D9085D|nr:helix-turn-helix transcriptional regulator [Vibrio sonorensis]
MDNIVATNAKTTVPFASRAMMDIMLSGLKLHHIAYTGVLFQSNAARIPLTTKREFLYRVREEHGLAVLLKLGRGAALHLNDPMGRALVPQSDVANLFSRWQRLERYVHANHYTEIELRDENAVVKHLSRTGEPPKLAEDLAVLGLMCALVAQSGARDVELYTGSKLDKLAYRYTGNEVDCSVLNADQRWKICWKESKKEYSTHNVPINDNQTWAFRARMSIEAIGLIDCNLDKVAKHQCVSVRSLQRHLSNEGVKFAQLLQDMRVSRAAELVMESDSCLAEIGFLCGFSDQAHFTRVFTQWNGMSPKAYLAVVR